MHPNSAFRRESRERALSFARERGFGVLCVVASDGVLAAHLPFLLEEERVAAHLARANPLARRLLGGPAAALMIVSGPDAYISPDWYGEADKVPTWNYVAVHLRGELRLLNDAALAAHLDRLAANFEARLAPKLAWTTATLDRALLRDLTRQIVPVAMTIESVDSTFKLNQNRSTAAQAGATAALGAGGTPGMETRALAALMRSKGALRRPATRR